LVYSLSLSANTFKLHIPICFINKLTEIRNISKETPQLLYDKWSEFIPRVVFKEGFGRTRAEESKVILWIKFALSFHLFQYIKYEYKTRIGEKIS
jgi:hypothetical protein